MAEENKMKELRKAAGLTQAEMAKKLNISPETVRSYERGRRAIPEKIITLSRALATTCASNDKTGTPVQNQIKADLLDQLKRNGTSGKFFTDLIDDYMHLWKVKTGLEADIKKRGPKVIVRTANSSNLKTNDSVIDLLKVNAQMLKILDSLGIESAGMNDGSDDEEM